jgi:conjugal transfer mating pair stabilization protein TraG
VLPEYKLRGGWWAGDPNSSGNLLQSIQVADLGFVTDDYLGGAAGTTSTGEVSDCANTYADLNQAWINPQTGIAAGFAGLMKVHTTSGTSVPDALRSAFGVLAANTTQPTGSSAGLPALLGQASQNAQQSIQNAVSANLLARGLAQGFRDANQAGEAGVIESAANQRNVQFAAQSTLFTRTLRATMTFFEGVIYGLAPFLAFLIPLGPIGFRYAGRYLQLLVWLFLWMPLLSFVNLFEVMAVLREMNALLPAIGNAPLISAIGLNQIEYTISDWIGMGGYLTTAVVGLSGMIVFGSVAAFQGVAAEANAPTRLDPTMLAPDVMNTAPPVQMGAQFSGAGGSALALSGAPMLSWNAGQLISTSEQATLARASTLAQQLQASGQFGKSINAQTLQAWSERYALTHGAHEQAGLNAAAPSSARTSTGSSTSVSTDKSISGHLGGNVGVAGVGLGGAQAGAAEHWRASTEQARQQSHSDDVTPTAGFSQTHGNDHSLSHDQGASVSGGTTRSASVARTESELYNTMQSYNQLAQASHSVGAGMTVTLPQAAEALAGNSAALDSVAAAAHAAGGAAFGENYARLGGLFPDSAQRTAAASLMTLQGVALGGGARGEAAQFELDRGLGAVPGWSALDSVGTAARAGAQLGGGSAFGAGVAGQTAGVAGDVASAGGLSVMPSSIGGVPSDAQGAFAHAAADPAYAPDGLRGGFEDAAARGLHGVTEFGPAPLEPIALPDHTGALSGELQASINQEFTPGAHPSGSVGLGATLGQQDLLDADALPSAGTFARMTPAQQKALEDFAKRPADPQQ